MKTKIILIVIMILLSVISVKAQYKINSSEPLSYGAYNTLTNAEPIIIGNDTIKAGGLRFEVLKIMNDNDTGFTVNKFEPLKYGKYGSVINKNKFIIGSDTIPAKKITANLIYLLGDETFAKTNMDNSLTGKNTFKQVSSTENTIIGDTIDCSKSCNFEQTLGANTNFTFSNFVSGQTINVVLTNTANSYLVSWKNPTDITIKRSGGTAPT